MKSKLLLIIFGLIILVILGFGLYFSDKVKIRNGLLLIQTGSRKPYKLIECFLKPGLKGVECFTFQVEENSTKLMGPPIKSQ